MMRTKWIGTLVLGGLLLGATPAAADVRWPWEKPKSKTEKKEKTPTTTRTKTDVPAPAATPAPKTEARAEDRDMLPKIAAYYQEQLDLADAAVRDAKDPQVKAFAEKLQGESERALGVINENARDMGIVIKPHVRVSLAEKLRQSGRAGRLGRPEQTQPQDSASDLEFLRQVMANIQEIRPEFATYKEQNTNRDMQQELGRLFNDELVPRYDEAKALHDRVRNAAR